jgi:spermidine/putrescine transport system ATP-binding protein
VTQPIATHASDLVIDGVAKSFGSTVVLSDLSFEVPSGEFLAVLGPSGSGKSTLLRLIAGLERADRGTIRLGGADLTAVPAHQRPVNTVFQSYALFPHLTVAGNVAFGLESRGVGRAEIHRKSSEALSLLELDGLEERLPHQLSGGQRQRVALARALVNEPAVLLLDEPLSALDAKLRAQVQLELRRLQRQLDRTFLLVTHDQEEAITVADRLLVLNQGKIEQMGSATEVYERPKSRFVAEFLGAANLIGARANGGAEVGTEVGPLTLRHAPPWQAGSLAIRPERVRVCASAPSVNGLLATVVDFIYRGDCLDLWVEPGPLRVRTQPGRGWQRGEAIWLELPPDHLEVLVD